ncbi:MAG: hypothetical protein BWY27_00542 [Bacteroidetes bacterium ADurb.Bin234]|jgi:hypothetical protein|nr:MAG: hypothetical protein BWY27_00542 [Bacteroidetes bacterium ADurb.Bin234]
MKKISEFSVYMLIIVLFISFSACNKAKPLIGTYEGVTTTSGKYKFIIPDYDEMEDVIPSENKNVTFEITKGSEKNQIILKQTGGESDEQFQTTGIINGKNVAFEPFDISIGYGDINVKVQANDMSGTFDDGLFTYNYSYNYYQSLMGASISIRMKASGNAQKNKK